MTVVGKPPVQARRRVSGAGNAGRAEQQRDSRPGASGSSGRRSEATDGAWGRGSCSITSDGCRGQPSAAPPHQTAACVQQQEAANSGNPSWRRDNAWMEQEEKQEAMLVATAAQRRGAPQGRLPRHMQSQLAELLCGLPPEGTRHQWAWNGLTDEAAGDGQQGGGGRPRMQQEAAGMDWPSPLLRRPQQQAVPAQHCELRAAEEDAPPANDFTRRNMGRLGGEGVAAILGGGGGSEVRPGCTHKRPAGGIFMAALSDIRAGLSDDQRARQVVQREQLKRDLEEQMREKREAEATRKAQLVALEEREEAHLQEYWAEQARLTREGQVVARAKGTGSGPAQKQQQQLWMQQQRYKGDRGGMGEAVGRNVSARIGAARGHEQVGAANSGGHGGGGMEPLAAVAGGARRGEALVQPGITVFLPPDKVAERQASLHACYGAHTCSDDAEAVLPLAGGTGHRPPATSNAAAAAGMLAQQQGLPLFTPAQAAAILAAANPAMMATAGGMHFYPYPAPATLPYLLPPATSACDTAAATRPADSSDPEVLALLRELQQEQQRMREQVMQQLEAVGRLSGDASAARSERDRARLDLERVQRMLAERPGAGAGAAVSHQPLLLNTSSEQDLLAVTTHVLPLGARQIPSRLGTPAHSAHPQPPPPPRQAFQVAEPQNLPARYRQQAVEPWQQQAAQRGGDAAAHAYSRPPAAGKGGSKQQGNAGQGKTKPPVIGGKAGAFGGKAGAFGGKAGPSNSKGWRM